jgi:hypothetical protein
MGAALLQTLALGNVMEEGSGNHQFTVRDELGRELRPAESAMEFRCDPGDHERMTADVLIHGELLHEAHTLIYVRDLTGHGIVGGIPGRSRGKPLPAA